MNHDWCAQLLMGRSSDPSSNPDWEPTVELVLAACFLTAPPADQDAAAAPQLHLANNHELHFADERGTVGLRTPVTMSLSQPVVLFSFVDSWLRLVVLSVDNSAPDGKMGYKKSASNSGSRTPHRSESGCSSPFNTNLGTRPRRSISSALISKRENIQRSRRQRVRFWRNLS